MSGVLKSHTHTHNKNRKGFICNKFSLGAPTPSEVGGGKERELRRQRVSSLRGGGWGDKLGVWCPLSSAEASLCCYF